jgi:hypothetical protein
VNILKQLENNCGIIYTDNLYVPCLQTFR